MNQPFVEIAIIFKDLSLPFVQETITQCLALEYDNFSLALYPDVPIDLGSDNPNIRIIVTGNASIPQKRNMAIKNLRAEADCIAFIDADAFPRSDWLKNAVRYFTNPEIMAVGGPNLTPEDEEPARKIAGFVMQQKIGFGSGAIRHKVKASRYIDELPTCNLIVRKNYIQHNFFDENYPIGEDTTFCYGIIEKGYKIFYAQDVIVYHHRRKIVLPLLKQFYNYGYHRSKVVCTGSRFTKESILPPLFFFYVVSLGLAALFNRTLSLCFAASLAVYFLTGIFSSLRETRNIFYVLLTSTMLFLGHLSYGLGFIVNAGRTFTRKYRLKKEPVGSLPE